MILEWLLNPWVIVVVMVAFVGGNIAALKYTANMKFPKEKNSFKKMADQQLQLEKQLAEKQGLLDKESDDNQSNPSN